MTEATITTESTVSETKAALSTSAVTTAAFVAPGNQYDKDLLASLQQCTVAVSLTPIKENRCCPHSPATVGTPDTTYFRFRWTWFVSMNVLPSTNRPPLRPLQDASVELSTELLCHQASMLQLHIPPGTQQPRQHRPRRAVNTKPGDFGLLDPIDLSALGNPRTPLAYLRSSSSLLVACSGVFLPSLLKSP